VWGVIALKIAVIGAGAMGSIFGSMLSKVCEVSLIDINDEHVEAVRKNGLIVENMDGSRTISRVFMTTRHAELAKPVDLAIIFTKSYHTQDAAFTAQAILDADGVALTLQNGIGNLEILQKVLGTQMAIAGVTSHGGTFLGPGIVRHAGKGLTHIANIPSKNTLIEKIAEIFNAANIETILSDNWKSLIWGKLIINVGINALAAICRVPNGIIGKNSQCLGIMKDAVSEAVAVSNLLGVKLPYEDPVEQVKKVCEATSTNRASMLQDVLRGTRTEIGAINGAIVDEAKALGILTPVNQFLTRTVKAIETSAEHRIG
jgi:2-dehydropantoate 2-reductase